MYVKNSVIKDFDNFKLDNSAIQLYSLSSTDIRLPYAGELPRQMSLISDAYIYFNVQPVQEVRVVLVVNKKSGQRITRPLVASTDELISLLDKFFKQVWENTGLEEYWLGLWYAHYIGWKEIVTNPDRLLNIVSVFWGQDQKT